MDDLRYPVGRFSFDPNPSPSSRRACIEQIAAAPAALREAVRELTAAQVETPYRPGGWTVRQVVHHVPDSHLNAYVRFKLALTEDNPTIKPYDEGAWAMLADTADTPVDVSLTLLAALHTRWVKLLSSMRDEDFVRPLVHPEHGDVSIDWLLQLYAWHGNHHVGHVRLLSRK